MASPDRGQQLPISAALPSGPSNVGSVQLQAHSSLDSVPREKMKLFGEEPQHEVSISIGLSSVKRKKDYILDTIGLMLGSHPEETRVNPSEKDQVIVIAHLADWDEEWVKSVSATLQDTYSDLVEDGHFHVIHAPKEYYPDLDVCPPTCTFKDEPTRVRWRSKQNIDYAFLMHYAIPMAPYYMQIEDDIGFANNWIQKIINSVSTLYTPQFRTAGGSPWRIIDYSELGYIGKLFHREDVIRMAQLLLLLYDRMPCDMLLGPFLDIMNQKKVIAHFKKHKSLFQHRGVFRTLGGFQLAQERKFGKLLFNNPAGTVTHNMMTVPTFDAKFAYAPGGDSDKRSDRCYFSASKALMVRGRKRCWFWAKNVRKGNHLTLVFDVSIHMKAISVSFSQLEAHEKDLLYNGRLQVAPPADRGACGNFVDLLTVDGLAVVYWEEGVDPPPIPMERIRCVRVLALGPQDNYLIIREILVKSGEGGS